MGNLWVIVSISGASHNHLVSLREHKSEVGEKSRDLIVDAERGGSGGSPWIMHKLQVG